MGPARGTDAEQRAGSLRGHPRFAGTDSGLPAAGLGRWPQPAGRTAGLPPPLLIIHPAQLGSAEKSHQIAFVLQQGDLPFTGVPFPSTLPTGFWGCSPRALPPPSQAPAGPRCPSTPPRPAPGPRRGAESKAPRPRHAAEPPQAAWLRSSLVSAPNFPALPAQGQAAARAATAPRLATASSCSAQGTCVGSEVLVI